MKPAFIMKFLLCLPVCCLAANSCWTSSQQRSSVIVTTNLPFEQWTEVLDSQRLTGEVLDRLTHHCHILEASGDSYRLKDARRRSGNRKNPSNSGIPKNRIIVKIDSPQRGYILSSLQIPTQPD